ncbi:hypothetical protein LTR09_002023 [Extremus antarcticus]|uniref:AB hydrolase-1 domain-containing protein n=1 Tax=Extremus antarcticus TaxID=702011 RepID=A0AAJ0LVS2_9PEZI|nr:hypothetical protein LTR09_002023 [Extremus antarcticus]
MPGNMHTLTAVVCFATSIAARPAIEWVDCHQYVPPPLFQNFPDANVSVVPPTLHCGQLVVPMNYAQPMSETNNITLGLAMYPNSSDHSNAGGSDQNTVFAWQAALGLNDDFQPDFSGLLEYDLMMMDVRGTCFSNPLNVSIEVAEAVLGPHPTNAVEYHTFEANAARMFRSWEQLSSPPGIIKHVGTAEVVQDFESIRNALGYETIHFLADSYGTYRAGQYAATFPRRVGHFALDAVVSHGLNLTIQAKQDVLAINRGIQRADAYCLNNSSCPFHEQGKGAVPQHKVLESVLSRARNGTLSACLGKSKKCSQKISAFVVQTTMYSLMQQNPDFPLMFEILAAALEGNGKGFVSTSTPTIDQFWAIVFLCNDNQAIEDKTFAAFKRMHTFAEQYDRFGVQQAVTYQAQLICSAYPFSAPPLQPVELEATMLLLTADFDVYDPTERTTFAWKHTPNSALVVRHGDDHVSFQLPKQQSTEITKEFLRTGNLPAAINDTFVTVYEPGSKREPVADPYDVPTGFAAGDVDSS